jgi:phage FluMu gp28-like protein
VETRELGETGVGAAAQSTSPAADARESTGPASSSVPPDGAALSPLSLLLPYQQRWVTDPAKFKIGVQSRQTGKSFGTACEAVVSCLTDPGTKWVCLSAGERQALEWLEKAKEWAEAFRMAIEGYAEERAMGEALLKQAEIRFANGSRIIAIPANPSTARGYSANVILDEFAYHEDPDKIWAAMFPSLTNPLAGTFMQRVQALYSGESTAITRDMKIRVVSTFNGRENKFYDLWEKREENGYSGHLVTIYDAIADGLPVDAEQLRAGLDDADAWAQEYECQPTDTSNVLLPYDLIALAESAEASESCGDDFFTIGRNAKPVFSGLDFGRSNDPSCCWSLEREGDILWTREVLMLHKTSTPDQVAILRRRIERSTRFSLDYTGPGIGLGDYLVQEFGEYDPERHLFGKIELCTFTVGFKRELFPKLRRKFEAPTKVRVPISRAVREDLHAMQQVVLNGEYNYWAPRTKEGHSDRCTALALAVRAAGEESAPFAFEEPERNVRGDLQRRTDTRGVLL